MTNSINGGWVFFFVFFWEWEWIFINPFFSLKNAKAYQGCNNECDWWYLNKIINKYLNYIL